MSDHVKNQHYVPRFLLKNFSSRGRKFIWAYDKSNTHHKITERPIRKVANEFYFYDQIKNAREGSFEYTLQFVENNAAPVFEKIIKEKSLRNLNSLEREKIALFIAAQIFRTKEHLSETERMSSEFISKLKEAFNQPIANLNAKWLWFSTLSKIPMYKDVLLKKVWHLIESKNDFLISDNPAVRQNSTVKAPERGTLGLDSYGIEIYLPISPSFVIAIFCEKIFREKGYNELYIQEFETQKEVIENLNWLQVINSGRFVFSSTRDFSFVEDIFKERDLF
ncbi:DUF4238 domain-containing protein [Leeuwenhoekiella sp. UBA6783]|uniref:DUF4238 domain-containing protein n=1 Tax=Leeuwenhoekiella sp. UBA6783 TaxID=1946747 RepID=UPI0025BA93C3|nr:DUF4238 domain-containing protein [Leeuwenhoekiella sp. UBA6783]|tara:strand:+ start:164 stop:1000 length:837 start_codon:yes stop_codon:yes gene_type:complete